MEFILFNFSELYLSSLGEFFYNFKTEDIVMQAKTAEDKSYLASEITWEDEIYSDCKITFFVNRNGFYTYLY